MTRAIELAKQCGVAHYLTPDGTTEMHGTDRQIEAFAELIAASEREVCLHIAETTAAAGRDAESIADAIRDRGEDK